MSLFAHGLDIGLSFWYVWTRLSCPNNNNIIIILFYFESLNLNTIVIHEIVCLFSKIYIYSSSFTKKKKKKKF